MTSLAALALTMGEPAGIGGEIALKAWLARTREAVPPFFLVDDAGRLARLAERLDWRVPVAAIDAPEEAKGVFHRALPVLPQALPVDPQPGRPETANARSVLGAIETAVRLVQKGRAAAIVTNPVQKQILYAAGFAHPGHTEYLAALAGGSPRPIMMLACPGLRVVPVTTHLPLADAVAALRTDEIVAVGLATAAALEADFGILRPRLAVAALNPHAGEQGALGRQEIEVIRPAVEALKRAGISVSGPAPADTLFHPRARESYDAALCMYHDQALIPLKTISFYEGVNVTLGLPFVRTSPDHGTALEIAGTGEADASSLIAALQMAAEMAAHRAGKGLA
ncbi:MAG: 4-hydroxythreonine-4-phosphate dehydrogenase PdxA [Alphaproteobacteria bacterium]